MLSPAKLNLNLRILGKRPDGFHEIQTLMVQLPGLADTLTISPATAFSFTCSDPSLPTDSRNLVVKAASAFSHAAREPLHLHIHLEKLIPHGAGLGGGSSNAAHTLLALNNRFNQPLKSADLHSIATSLGSDIPFFLTPGAATCTGRGEIITPAPSPPPHPIVLFKPAFPVSTPDAYRQCLTAQPLPGIHHSAQTYQTLEFINDLETPVFAKHRYLAELKSWLLAQGPEITKIALMSGSGSTIFSILHPTAHPHQLIEKALKTFDPHLWTWSGTL